LGKKAFLPARVLAAAGLAAPKRSRGTSERVVAISRCTIAPGTVVLGVDPGTILVGYGAIEVTAHGPRFLDAGVVRPDRGSAVPQRLGEIHRQISILLEKFRPAVVVVERAFAARNVQSALRIGEGRGVILACAAAFGAEVVEITPASAKKAVVGHGGADKVQVAKMAAAALSLREPPRPLDASDALALALAHIGTRLVSLQHGRSARER